MSLSSEFHEHTSLLHDNARQLLGRSAIEIVPGRVLGVGLLNHRSMDGYLFRPRLIIVSGLAEVVGHALERDVLDDVLVIGATRDDDPYANIGRIYAVGPGLARDILKKDDLDAGRVAQFSHSIRVAELEQPDAQQINLYHERITEKLGQLHPA